MQASIVVEILQNLTEASTILATSSCKPEDWGKISAIITIAEIKLRVHSGLYYLEIPIENDLPQTTGENIPLDTSTNPE
jgi:hypothetical protein